MRLPMFLLQPWWPKFSFSYRLQPDTHNQEEKVPEDRNANVRIWLQEFLHHIKVSTEARETLQPNIVQT